MVIKCTQLTILIRVAPQFWEWGYKTILRAEPAEFCVCLPFTCDILGYVSRKWCRNSPFYILHIFSGALEPWCFFGAMGSPLDTHLCRVELFRKLNEWERGVTKYGGAGAGRSRSGTVSGGYRNNWNKIAINPSNIYYFSKHMKKNAYLWTTEFAHKHQYQVIEVYSMLIILAAINCQS